MNPNWEICQWIDYCSGPEVEGVEQDTPFVTRWEVKLDTRVGNVSYGKDSNELDPAPLSLFPVALELAVAISLSFDQNSEPVFAIGFSDGHIEVRRNVLGVPTTYSFTGVTPRLLYNGILLSQTDPSNTDVICYYVNGGQIKARYQRDNFGVEYNATNFPFPVLSIKKVDTKEYREILYVKRRINDVFTQNYAIRSPVYPLAPISEEDAGSLGSVINSGRYLDIIVVGGTYLDESNLGSVISAGQYLNIIVEVSESDDAGLDSIIMDGNYELVIIQGGGYAESGSLGSLIQDGEYVLVIIGGGSYSEDSSLGSVIASGSYYT